MPRLKKLLCLGVLLYLTVAAFGVLIPPAQAGANAIAESELRAWLEYLAADDRGGRDTFSDGLVESGTFIAERLRQFGIKPGGPDGSYFQRVAVKDVEITNHSSVTVKVNGRSRTFKNGEGIQFQASPGASRTFVTADIVFAGYGLQAPSIGHNDFEGLDLRGKTVVWIGNGPSRFNVQSSGGVLHNRGAYVINQQGAAASIGVSVSSPSCGQSSGGCQSESGGCSSKSESGSCSSKSSACSTASTGKAACNGNSQSGCDAGGAGRTSGSTRNRATLVTTERLDLPVAPQLSAEDAFFSFLFQGADLNWQTLKARADKGESLPSFELKNVSLKFHLRGQSRVVQTRFSNNIVGLVEGADPVAKNTFVTFGAHYDHLGQASPKAPAPAGSCSSTPPASFATVAEDHIWNGADDNGSGTVTLLALAKAFAEGPKPRRSVLFLWYTGEERGLWGSRYFVDYSTVPLDAIAANVNFDMVGRTYQNKSEFANTMFLIGSDWISSDLHRAVVDQNQALSQPFDLDFSMNRPDNADLVYFRSDHYSFAARGIPAVFMTTGSHTDYHAPSDTADKIDYRKLLRVIDFGYQIGLCLANTERLPVRDYRGPRSQQ